MSAKLQEAQEHCKAAEKFLKTSFLRWKPDCDSAADEYSQAAQCYRIARDLSNSKECHLKASDLYKKNRSFFHAAKALENAIIVCKETSTHEDLYNLACEAANLYQQHGSGDSGASILDKTAKMIENKSPDLAVKLFQQAAEVSSISSSQHQGSEYISKASRILVKLQRYDEAVDSLRREIGFHQEANNTGAVGRLTVAIVLVQLARGDAVAAEKAYKELCKYTAVQLQLLIELMPSLVCLRCVLTTPFATQAIRVRLRLYGQPILKQEWGNNCEVAEMQTIEQLLQAYDEEDRESAKRALASPFIRSMDVEYARLATIVPLPEGIEPAPKATVRENAAPSYVSGSATQDDTGAYESSQDAQAPYQPPQQEEEEDELC